MPKFARIVDGVVQEILNAPSLPPFHPSIAAQWLPAPADVTERWTYASGAYTPPQLTPPPETPADRFEALRQLYAQLPVEVQVQFGPVMAQVAQFAQFDGWPAIAYLLNTLAPQIPDSLKPIFQQMLAVAHQSE